MNKPLRVLFITNLYPPYHIGGYEIACRDIAEGFKKNGHIVRILTSTHGIGQPSRSNSVWRLLDIKLKLNTPQSVLEKSKMLFFNPRNYRITKDSLDDFKPHIVSFWSINGISASTIYAAQKARIPKVFHLFDRALSYLRKTGGKGILNFVLFNRLGIDNLISSSAELRNDYLSRGFEEDSITIIPHGINLEVYARRQKETNGILKLLFVGQIWEAKGMPVLLSAVSKLKKQGISAKLTVVGSGEDTYLKQLDKLCRSLNISQNVSFLGKIKREKLTEIYHANHILICPSVWKEPFGIVLLEAMATGMPVIASNYGGPLDIVEDGESGFLFKRSDADDLVEKILRFEKDRGIIISMGESARKRIEEHFGLSYVISKTIKHYSEILTMEKQ